MYPKETIYKMEYPYLDLHVAGEPFRLIYSDRIQISGNSMFEKKLRAQWEVDEVRKLTLQHPRGYLGMYGGLLLPPVRDDSDYGILFMHSDGYSNMCGHGVLAVGRALFELYPERFREGENEIRIDTPADQIRLLCTVAGHRLEKVSFVNTECFVCDMDKKLNIPGIGALHIDIVFAGGFMVYVDAQAAGVKISAEHVQDLLEIGAHIAKCVSEEMDYVHPLIRELSMKKCGFCLIFTDPVKKNEDTLISGNFTIYGKNLYDYSPTGTGTSGRLALLEQRGEIRPNQVFRNYGISGEPFEGEIAAHGKVGIYSTIIPRITGKAYVTGKGKILLETGDPFPAGIKL